MGGGFKTEVTNLEDAANKALRPLADELRQAREQLSSTADFDSGFTAAHPESHSVFGAAGGYWSESRGFLERIFDDNAETLDLAAQALLEIARRYREVDEGVSNSMQSLEEGLA